ncbi:hypothetical protein HMI56_004223, partial [Coelomomyces lativittatus]
FEKEQIWVSDDDKEIEIRNYNGYNLANQEKFEVMNVHIKSGKSIETVLHDQVETEGYIIHVNKKEALINNTKQINTVQKRVADKIKLQNIRLPQEARLETGNLIKRPLIKNKFTTENITKIKFSSFLKEKEKEFFLQQLSTVQGALGFSIQDLGIQAEGIEKLIKIHT